MLRLPPLVVTFGSRSIFFAINLWYSGARSIHSADIAAAAPFLRFLSERIGLRGAYGAILMVVIFAVPWYMLNRTAWGRHVYAVGDDKEAVEIAGRCVSPRCPTRSRMTGAQPPPCETVH
jgi:fructose transport system permease protein